MTGSGTDIPVLQINKVDSNPLTYIPRFFPSAQCVNFCHFLVVLPTFENGHFHYHPPLVSWNAQTFSF